MNVDHVVHAQNQRKMGKFSFMSSVKGEYKIMFSNLNSPTEKSVMLGIFNQEEAEAQDSEIDNEFNQMETWASQQPPSYRGDNPKPASPIIDL